MIYYPTVGHDPRYNGEPFALVYLDGYTTYFTDKGMVDQAESFARDMPAHSVVLHQEYYIDVLRYEHRDRYGNLVGEPSICTGSAVEDLDIELAEGDTLTVTAKRMLRREFDEMDEL